MNLKEKFQEIEYEYSFDQTELARILIIASTTLLIFSLHGITQLQSSAEKLDSLESEYSKLSGMIGTEKFNNTVQALEDVQGGSIAQQMQFTADVFRSLQNTGLTLEKASSDINHLVSTYRWLFLIAILGEVAGVSLIYM